MRVELVGVNVDERKSGPRERVLRHNEGRTRFVLLPIHDGLFGCRPFGVANLRFAGCRAAENGAGKQYGPKSALSHKTCFHNYLRVNPNFSGKVRSKCRSSDDRDDLRFSQTNTTIIGMNRIQRFSILLALVFTSTLTVDGALAQFRVGPHVGVNFEGTDFFIGANSHFSVQAGNRTLIGNPSADFYLFQDNVSLYRVNADVLLPFMAGSFSPFVGAGLSFQITKFDEDIPFVGGETDSDVGINVRFGAFFGDPDSAIRPFVDGAVNLVDGTDFAARGGASFRITN